MQFNPWVGTIHWNRKWQPTPVLLPAEFDGQRSLMGFSPWGHKAQDMTEHSTQRAGWEEKGLSEKNIYYVISLVAQMVKHLSTTWETRIRALGWEDPLEKGMATQSSILAWRNPWTEVPDGLQFTGSQRVRVTE